MKISMKKRKKKMMMKKKMMEKMKINKNRIINI